MPWPPTPKDLTKEKIEVSHFVDIFLNKLLSGSSEPSESIRVNRLKISFYQALLYAVCNGRIKTVKSILYSTVVKTLSNNTGLLRFANLLGHGVSYTVLEELETEAAISLIGQQKSYTNIPEGFFRDVFTMLVYDYIDRREGTISGGNTSHKVNGIIIQPKHKKETGVERPIDGEKLPKRLRFEDIAMQLQENAEQSVTEAPIYESRAHMEGYPMEVTVSTVESNISIDDRKKGHRRSLAGYMPVVTYDYIPGKRIGP